jgi:hypothetical protein
MGKPYHDGFVAMQRSVAGATVNDRLQVFSNLCREAAGWTRKSAGPSQVDVIDRMYDIAVGTGLVAECGEDPVQAAMAAAFADLDLPKGRFPLVPFDRLRVGREPRYLVKGLLPATGLALIWGPPKCGKSFFTFDVLMHVAMGKAYRGRRVQSGAIVYLAPEGAEGFNARAEAYRRQHVVDTSVPFYLVPAPVNLVADHPALIDAIKEQLAGKRPVAVAVDTLNRSMPGSESKDEDMAAYIRAADAIRDAFGCLVVIVHHSGIEKSRPRGHTSLTGAADAQISVARDAAGNIIATLEWLKDGAEGAIVVSRLEPVELGTDTDGDPISSCVVVPAEGVTIETTARPRLTKGAQIALKGLHQALHSCGEPAPSSNHIPSNVTVTTIDQWRNYTYRLGLTNSDKPRARQMAFQRASEALIAAGVIGVWEPHVWSAEMAHR